MQYSNNPREDMVIFTPGYLETLPTISQGQADDLKVESGNRRYWLARCGPEDGEDWDVHVEQHDQNGKWEPLVSYREES